MHNLNLLKLQLQTKNLWQLNKICKNKNKYHQSIKETCQQDYHNQQFWNELHNTETQWKSLTQMHVKTDKYSTTFRPPHYQILTLIYILSKTLTKSIASNLSTKYSIIIIYEFLHILYSVKTSNSIVNPLNTRNLFTNVPAHDMINTILKCL